MENAKFTQLALSEWRQEGNAFELKHSDDDNHFTLISTAEARVGELSMNFNAMKPLPFRLSTLELPQDRTFAPLLNNIDHEKIYDSCSIMERQEYRLDPIYLPQNEGRMKKAEVQSVELAPIFNSSTGARLLTILTSFGCCQLRSQQSHSRSWDLVVDNLNRHIFADNIFPLAKYAPKPAETFKELRHYCDLYVITSFTWESVDNQAVIYMANGAGYILGFTVTANYSEEEEMKVQSYCYFKTSLGRITFLKCFGDFLLVGNLAGQVHLLSIKRPSSSSSSSEILATLELHTELWSQNDRISIQYALIQFVKEFETHLVIFSKSSNLIIIRLPKTLDGSLNRATYYLGGGHVTGITALSSIKYVVCTMTGGVRILLISWSNELKKLSISEQPLDVATALGATYLNSNSMQVLGVAASNNRALWLFPIRRTRNAAHGPLKAANTLFISICNFSEKNAVTTLSSLPPQLTMDVYRDWFAIARLEIYNSLWSKEDVKEQLLPQLTGTFDDAMLQRLQISMFYSRSFDMMQSPTINTNINDDPRSKASYLLSYLQRAVRATTLLRQLDRIFRLIDKGKHLSSEQRFSVSCICTSFQLLIDEIRNIEPVEPSPDSDDPEEQVSLSDLRKSIADFVHLAMGQFEKTSDSVTAIETSSSMDDDYCMYCKGKIDTNTLCCVNGHSPTRCYISCIQAPLFAAGRYCSLCDCSILDTVAETIVTAGDANTMNTVPCPMCRFSFLHSDRY